MAWVIAGLVVWLVALTVAHYRLRSELELIDSKHQTDVKELRRYAVTLFRLAVTLASRKPT